MGILDTQLPAIRAAISTALTAADLPDAMIALPIYQRASEREAAALVAGLTLTSDQQDELVEAAIYLCAARLAIAVPSIKQMGVGRRDLEFQAQPLTPDVLSRQLRARALAIVATIRGETGRPTVFTKAPGGRAQSKGYVIPVPLGTTITGQGG